MNNQKLSNLLLLRQKAEAKIAVESAKSDAGFIEMDVLRINHELHIHQIELEMQNEELVLAKEQANEITEKYIELYNFAPIGYFTLSRGGNIIEINKKGSQMLGMIPNEVNNTNFDFFICNEDKQIFSNFIDRIFESEIIETCTVRMPLKDNSVRYVLLTGYNTKNGEYCLTAATDISKRLQLEKDTIELQQFNSYFIGRELRMVELKKEINELLQKYGSEKKYPVS